MYIPKQIAKDFGWKPGDRIAVFVLRRNLLLATKIEEDTLTEVEKLIRSYSFTIPQVMKKEIPQTNQNEQEKS